MEKSFEGFEGCLSVEEVVYRYSFFKELGIDEAVLDWNMYAYINDYLEDEIWEKSRGVKHEG